MEWFRHDGDSTFRVQYDLSPESIVIDLGGYKGDFAKNISDRYDSYIHVFEPIPDYFSVIRHRFSDNPKISVYPYAAGAKDETLEMNVMGDASSSYKGAEASVTAQSRSASRLFDEIGLTRVDLLKINVEGAEYPIIHDLFASGWIERIQDIQVQFHDFVAEADTQLAKAHSQLARSHHPTYSFKYVWENWTRSPDESLRTHLVRAAAQLAETNERIALLEMKIAALAGA